MSRATAMEFWQNAGWYPPNEVSRVAGAMRGASRSGQAPDYLSRNTPLRARAKCQKFWIAA